MHYRSRFADEGTEAQRGEVSCPRAQSWHTAKPELKVAPTDELESSSLAIPPPEAQGIWQLRVWEVRLV